MNTKTWIGIIVAVVIIIGIGIVLRNQGDDKAVDQAIVGNDRDSHGCIGSAGYTYSQVRGECIRVFESGVRLDPQDSKLDQTISAFVVFQSDDQDAQAELFLPPRADSVVINKTLGENAGEWKNDMYTLSQWKGMYTLTDESGKTLYQGAQSIPLPGEVSITADTL
jgi:hypothetical protein